MCVCDLTRSIPFDSGSRGPFEVIPQIAVVVLDIKNV